MTGGCLKWIQERMHPEDLTGVRTTVLVLTEIVRWMAFVVPIYLAVWRWVYFKSFTFYINEENARGDFWGIMTGIFLSASLLVYLPLKLYSVKFLGHARQQWGWRPSILQYILLCALPSFSIILIAVQTRPEDMVMDRMDEDTMIALQMTVMGLTITEWMAKLREEVFTYDLVSAMAADFFFAYDVIDFVMMMYHDTHIIATNWIYVTFVFSFTAMFKYLPTPPTSICDDKTQIPKGAVTSIIVTMICQDIPFVAVRLTTMILYGFAVSDLIHPAKNIALIIFGVMQLYIIYKNYKTMQQKSRWEFEERRKSRFNGREKFIEVVEAVTAANRLRDSARPSQDTVDQIHLNERRTPQSQAIYPPLDMSS